MRYLCTLTLVVDADDPTEAELEFRSLAAQPDVDICIEHEDLADIPANYTPEPEPMFERGEDFHSDI